MSFSFEFSRIGTNRSSEIYDLVFLCTEIIPNLFMTKFFALDNRHNEVAEFIAFCREFFC